MKKDTKVNKSQKIKAKALYNNLLEQVKALGRLDSVSTNLIEDYIDLWTLKELLKQDILDRGVKYSWSNGSEQKGIKQNESITELHKISGLMLKLLSLLGIDSDAEPPSVRL